MLEPEQILHASMILSVESEDSHDDGLILQVQEALGCDSSDHDAAMSHIEQHRDDGNWGGRCEAVLNRSRERVREAMNVDLLPSVGSLADSLNSLIGVEDDGEIDPFEELGVSSDVSSLGAAAVATNDPLAAFMDDDEEEADLVDESGFLASDSSLEFAEDDDEEEATSVEATELSVEDTGDEDGLEPEISPDAGYEMLLSTCWIDGILDPAEAKLLASKREELGITFEQHLGMLRNILENSP